MATSITIRHVPEEVRNELAARAARSGRSLQEYMLNEVVRLTSRPSIEDMMASVRGRKQRTPTQIGRDAILADRDADRR
jgi:plasmid stability protein